MTDDLIKVECLFGFVDIRAWIELRIGKNGEYEWVGMGSKKTYDEDGNLISVVVEPTGVIARMA